MITQNKLNLDSQVDFDISVLLGNRKTFKVVSTLKYKSEREINKIIQSKNLNKEIKEKLYLNEDTRSKEVVQIWSELIFPKKRKRNKGNKKSFSKNINDIKIHIDNLEFLRSSITKCLSNDISKKYKRIPSDAIILIISRLFQDENKNYIFTL